MFGVRLVVLAAIFLTTAVSLPGKAIASDSTDVMATVNSAVTAFNKGDGKTWLTLCAPSAPVISNTPPYQFQSCADWWKSNADFNEKNGISGVKVTLEKAWDVAVTGDRAYASLPAALAFKQKGKAMSSSGVLTIALQKASSGWLMTGWSWSTHSL